MRKRLHLSWKCVEWSWRVSEFPEKQKDSAERAELLWQTTSVSESMDQAAVDGR